MLFNKVRDQIFFKNFRYLRESFNRKSYTYLDEIDMKECKDCGTENDPDAQFCKRCGEKLMSKGDDSEGDEATLDKSQEEKEGSTAGVDIEKLKAEHDIQTLNKLLDHQDKKVRFDAADSLGDLAWYDGVADESSIPKLNGLLDDPDPEVRMSAVLAIGQLAEAGVADKRSIPKLNEALEDEDIRVREFAVDALRSLAESGIADKSSLPKLNKVLKDTHDEVRGFAENTIKKLKKTLRG